MPEKTTKYLKPTEAQVIHQIRSVVSDDDKLVDGERVRVWFWCGRSVMCYRNKDGNLTPAFNEKGWQVFNDESEIRAKNIPIMQKCKKCFPILELKKSYLVKSETGYSNLCPHCESPNGFYPTSDTERKALAAEGTIFNCFKCKRPYRIFIGSAEFVELNQTA